MACFIIGDSLAVGVGQFRPDCLTEAKVGITSGNYLAKYLTAQGFAGDTVVISLGVNDGDTSGTLENLRFLRTRVKANAVYWLLPGLKPDVRDAIRDVAGEHGDRLIDTLPVVGRDHLHPNGTGYQRLAEQTFGGHRDVEVAYAPVDGWAPTQPGANYPRQVGAIYPVNPGTTYPTRPSPTYTARTPIAPHFSYGPATPRERIRRQRELRAADTSAPALRHGPLTHHALPQREARAITPSRPATGPSRPALGPSRPALAEFHSLHCSMAAPSCRASMKPAISLDTRELSKRQRIQARVLTFKG